MEGIAEGCRQAGAALIGGETAEMPGMYQDADYDLAGFSVGAVERDRILPTNNIETGDVLLGLASSGVHSNGFSLVRRIVELENLDWNDPAPYASGKTLGEALLEPTRIYVRPLIAALRETNGIKGLAHITGGGFTENIPRVLPENVGVTINLDALEPPAVFGWLAKSGGIETREMLRTFNCGIGMVVVVAAENAETVAKVLEREGEKVSAIGRLNSDAAGGMAFEGALKW